MALAKECTASQPTKPPLGPKRRREGIINAATRCGGNAHVLIGGWAPDCIYNSLKSDAIILTKETDPRTQARQRTTREWNLISKY